MAVPASDDEIRKILLETKTIALAIYDRVQGFDMAGAGLMSAVLLLLSMFAIGITFLTSSRQRRKHGPAA